ncbi:MAG: tetratricopeptide repeat protein [Thermoanaerobaculia bacterium]
MARSEAARAERVRAYLVSVFAAAEPSRTLGAKIEARSLVDEGVRRVDAELEGEPELHAEMLDLFAGLYRQLGELDAGLAIARRSYDDRRARLGDEDPATAKSEWTLGWILSNRGDFAVARGTSSTRSVCSILAKGPRASLPPTRASH